MRPLLPLFALIALAAPGLLHAQQVYRCEIDGRVAYSDQPCSDDTSRVQAIVVDPPEPARVDPPAGTREATAAAADVKALSPYERNMRAMQHANRLNELERDCIAEMSRRMAQRSGYSGWAPPAPRAEKRTEYPMYGRFPGAMARAEYDRQWAQERQREVDAQQRYYAQQQATANRALSDVQRFCAMERRAEEMRLNAGGR